MTEVYFDAGPPAAGQKVCLATTAYANLDPGYVFSIQSSRQSLKNAGIESAYLLISGNCHVDDARNCVVREFMNSDCTDLVFLDADVSWEDDALIQLCRYDCAVVGGVYPYRRKGKEDSLPVRPLLGNGKLPPDGLIEVEGAPTGFLRIKRHVLKELMEKSDIYETETGPVPIIFERTFEDGIRWGGDLEFCRKWRKLGGQIFIAPELRLGHAGRFHRVDSFSATMRRLNHLTLRIVSSKIKDKKETPADIVEVSNYIGNKWGAEVDFLATAIALARNSNGPILEAGSGLSTILMAAATKETVFCLEHDNVHASKLVSMATEAGVRGIGLCVCPIKNGWYDLTDYPDLPNKFSLAVVDGPPRNISNRKIFFDKLGKTANLILCDDTNEKEYKDYLTGWCKANNYSFTKMGQRISLLCKNEEN